MRLTTFFPFLADLKHYTTRDLRGDLLCALTVTPMAIPQAMAYALIAGVHPQYGIYTAIFPVVVTALWGSSRFLIAGPTNSISMVLFSSLATVSIGGVLVSSLPEEVRMPYIFLIALLAGLIQIVMGLARLGDLTNFISHSVMTAFVAGAALLIAAGQLNTILGLSLPRAEGGFFPQVAATLAALDQTNPWSLGIAAATVVLALLFRRISRRFPSTLAALVVTSALSALLGAADHGVKMVGSIPSVLPPLSLPQTLDPDVWKALFFPALAMALLGTVESLAIGKQMASINRDTFDGSTELIGQGLGNVVAGLTSGLPGCGSFTRSALMFSSGGRTRFGVVFTGLLTLPMLLLLAPLVSWLPMPALSGVLLLACLQMVNMESLRLSFETTRSDRIVLLITLASTLIFDLERALFIGVILSLLLYIQRSSHPIVRKLSHNSPLLRDVPDRPRGLVVYSIEGSLFFGAIHELERKLTKLEKKEVRLIVLHITRVFWIDASGAHALMLFLERCYARSVPVILVVSNREVRETLRRAGMLKDLSEGFITNRLKDGINLGIDLLNRISCYQEEEADGTGTSCQIANHRPATPGSAQDRAATGQKA